VGCCVTVLTQQQLYCTYVCGSVCERGKLTCAFSSLQSGVKAAVCECEFTEENTNASTFVLILSYDLHASARSITPSCLSSPGMAGELFLSSVFIHSSPISQA